MRSVGYLTNATLLLFSTKQHLHDGENMSFHIDNSTVNNIVIPQIKEPYVYGMYYNGGKNIIYAQTIKELVNALIPQYNVMQNKEQDLARITLSMNYAEKLQAVIIDKYILQTSALYSKGKGNIPTISENDWRILISPRRGTQPNILTWECPIPLVIVNTDSSKILSDKKDNQNILVIDPSTDETFITTLNEYNIVNVYMKNQ